MSPRRARNPKETALTVGVFEASLFGPQTRWSSLLGQREHLQNEIARGRRHLDQLRKDLAECDVLERAFPTKDKASGRNGQAERRRQLATNDSIEQFLSGWLEHLEEQLAAVVAEIQALEPHNAAEPIFPEESMYELLRAAG
jgi:hypothetical protein